MTLKHTLQKCLEFLAMIQMMMDNGKIKFYEEINQEKRKVNQYDREKANITALWYQLPFYYLL